jgi:hypothetical protein
MVDYWRKEWAHGGEGGAIAPKSVGGQHGQSEGGRASYAYVRPGLAPEDRVDVMRRHVKSLRNLPTEVHFFSVLQMFFSSDIFSQK